RMSEGHDLIPIAMQGEVDLSAAWRLARVINKMARAVLHVHAPRAGAMGAQMDCCSVTSVPIRDRIAADGIPRAKMTTVNEGVDVERIVRMPAANVHAEFYLPRPAPICG